MDRFLFRERLRSSRPPLFFLPGTCEEKASGQGIWAAGDKRAHAGSMPACLAITAERAFACPLHPARSASLRGCERHDLVRCECEPFSVGFRRGRVIWLCNWPRPHLLHATPDSERMKSSSALWQRLSTRSGLNGLRLRNHLAAGWMSAFFRGTIRPSGQCLSHLFPEVHDELTKSWRAPYSSEPQSHITEPCRATSQTLDVPTRRLDKQFQHFTQWLCSRSFRPRCSPMRKRVWIQPLSGTWGAQQTWLYLPPKPPSKPSGVRCPAW